MKNKTYLISALIILVALLLTSCASGADAATSSDAIAPTGLAASQTNMEEIQSTENESVSNSLNLNLELESNTIIANVITANDVRKSGANLKMYSPLYLIEPNPIPTRIRSNKLGILSFLEISEDNNPIRRITKKIIKTILTVLLQD